MPQAQSTAPNKVEDQSCASSIERQLLVCPYCKKMSETETKSFKHKKNWSDSTFSFSWKWVPKLPAKRIPRPHTLTILLWSLFAHELEPLSILPPPFSFGLDPFLLTSAQMMSFSPALPHPPTRTRSAAADFCRRSLHPAQLNLFQLSTLLSN